VNEGNDTVQSLLTYTLGTYVENLTLTGTSAINGTGNRLANVLTGNRAVNTLTCNAGNDTLDGGLGNDLYVFIDANDYITIASEFQATNYGIERLEVSNGHYITRQDFQTIVDTMNTINNNSGMDVMQKYTAMMSDQQYQNLLAASWHQ
jgi:Ca2+-binding RTX toxin-like protein